MAWLGTPLPLGEQRALSHGMPRTIKDRVEEELFARRVEEYSWLRVSDKLPMAHYADALRELEARSRELEGVLGMYDLGPISFPGLSDIDVVFVVEDGFRDFGALRRLMREAQPVRFHDVLLHDPYFIRRADLDGFLGFAPIFQYRAIWARAGLPAGGVVEDPADMTLFLMDIIAESYPREFIQLLAGPAIDERMLVSRLKGLAYCFDLLRRIGGGGEDAFERFAGSITTLRADFFELEAPERARRLLGLAKTAVTLSQRLALKASDHLAATVGLRVGGRLDLFCAGAPAIYSETAGNEPRFDLVHLRRSEVFAVAPAVYGWLACEYARGAGPFSRRLRGRMRDRLRVAGAPPEAFIQAVQRRGALRDAHTAWADASGIGLSTFLTFGYRVRRRLRGKQGLKELAGRLADRAREELMRRRMGKL
jgi:hypothetical protein